MMMMMVNGDDNDDKTHIKSSLSSITSVSIPVFLTIKNFENITRTGNKMRVTSMFSFYDYYSTILMTEIVVGTAINM